MSIRNYVDELGEIPGGASLTRSIPSPADGRVTGNKSSLETSTPEAAAELEDTRKERRGALRRRAVLRIQMWFWLVVAGAGLAFAILSMDGHLWGPIGVLVGVLAALDRLKRRSSLKRYV